MSEKPISPLRRRMLEDMTVRRIGEKTQSNYIRHVETFTAFLGRSPATATAEDVRRFQVHLTGTGVGPSSINQAATALRLPQRSPSRHCLSFPNRCCSAPPFR